MDNENSWEMCIKHLSDEEQTDFLRLNLPTKIIEADLDDVSQLLRLQSMTQEYLDANNIFVDKLPQLDYYHGFSLASFSADWPGQPIRGNAPVLAETVRS